MNRETTNDRPQNHTHPPKAPLAFRIGIVGHRPNRLGNASLTLLATQIHTIVDALRTEVLEIHKADQTDPALRVYSDAPPVIQALSPLAEGVDRIFAEQAIEAGCQLTAVLPFAQANYEADFEATPNALDSAQEKSLDHFRRLLGKAETVFQLDGSRSDSPRAYGSAGMTVLNQSDLMIVVWDGERRGLRGGTEETFDLAIDHSVPVVWVDAYAPHHWRIVTQPIQSIEDIAPGDRAALVRSHTIPELQAQVRKLVDFPRPPDSTTHSDQHSHGSLEIDSRQGIRDFYSSKQEKYNLFFIWKMFRDGVGDFKFKRPAIKVTPYEDAVVSDWPRCCDNPIAAKIDRLRPYYAWPDKLADRYADRYRSAFVFVFIAAAFSVAMALGSVFLGLPEESHLAQGALAAFELVAILVMLAAVFCGKRWNWHRRWLDYRLLAEIIRHQRLVMSLGGERATPSIPEHWTGYGNLGATWMAWYARAVERSLGLPTVVVDRAYLQSCLKHLKDQLAGDYGQIAFHKVTSARSDRIDHRLHLWEALLLLATLLCCVLHLLIAIASEVPDLPIHWLHEIPSSWLTFFCGFLPAVGAALAGINNQGEFRRIAQRSKSMSERLGVQLKQIEYLEDQLSKEGWDKKQLSIAIKDVSGNIARTMVSEVLDWRVIFQDRPLKTG